MWKLDRTQLGKSFFVLLLAMALSVALIIGCNGGGGGGDDDDDDDDGGGSSISFKVNEADWRMVSNQYDLNNNGTIDHKVTRIYEGGNCTRENVDLGNDDITDEYEAYYYDGDNFLIEIRVDSDGDGFYETHELDTYANGLPRLDTVYHDDNLDPDYQIEYTYDANGYPASLAFTNLTNAQTIKYWIWDEADGRIEYANSRRMSTSGVAIEDFDYAWTYNSSGDMTYEIYDLNSDDVNESITSWTYTTVGNRLIVREDRGDDDVVDWVQYTTYDTDGNETVEEIDSDNNLVMDEAEYYEYDAYGNRIEERDDDDMDGNIDDADYWDYELLGNGDLQVTEESDDDGDGIIDNVIIMTYERRP